MSQALAEGREQDRIDQEASEWLVLRESRALDRDERRAFDAWRAADARHAATYGAMERTWGDIPELRALADLVPLEAAPAETPVASRRPGRWIAACVVAAAAALALLWLPSLQLSPAPQSYATQVAEIRALTLPDGTRVTLGPRTTLTDRFNAGERRVVLAGGEAFFDVAHNAARPFVIEAGGSLVRVTGTRFNVNSSATSLRVSVLEGSVEVTGPDHNGERSRPQVLTAGQRLVIASAAGGAVAAGDPPVVERSPSERPGAWREGRLVYDNARLVDLVADVNRYYAPGVMLADPSVGELRITASFRASEIPAFMNALGGIVPVRARETPTGGFRVERAPS